MKKITFFLNIVFSFGLIFVFSSCSNDELITKTPNQETRGWHSAKVKFNVSCEDFGQNDKFMRAVNYKWLDDEVVYLLLTDKDGNKVPAYIKYDGDTQDWGEVIYDGYKSYLTCSTERVAEAYYLKGVNDISKSTLTLHNTNAIYVCSNGTYVYPSDGDMVVNVQLKPLTGRISFKGSSGTNASIRGIKTYTSFSTVTGKLTESVAPISTTVATNGSTPYLYCLFEDSVTPSLTISTDKRYRTVFDASSSILQSGKSGFLRLPTAEDHRGWKTLMVAVTGVTLNKTSLSLSKGATESLIATIAPADATDKSLTWTSSNASVATVDNNGKVTAVGAGSATITVKSMSDASKTATCVVKVLDANGHAYVDLGLTSGTLWATMNVGASSESDYGSYFAWGETTTKSSYYSSNYTYSSNPTTLPLSNDVAHVKWGGSWTMPTKEQFSELTYECTWTWTTMNGKNGYKVVSKKNSNYIFFPAAGYYGSSSVYNAGSAGYYWSSSLYSSTPSYAYFLHFDSSGIGPTNGYNRYRGQSVRPVLKE